MGDNLENIQPIASLSMKTSITMATRYIPPSMISSNTLDQICKHFEIPGFQQDS